MHVKFHIDKWVPEVKGSRQFPGSVARWQSTFVVEGGEHIDTILAARRHAIATAREMEDKTTTRWRVRKVETEVIYERETIQSDTGSAPSDTGAGSRRSRVAAICSPRVNARVVKK